MSYRNSGRGTTKKTVQENQFVRDNLDRFPKIEKPEKAPEREHDVYIGFMTVAITSLAGMAVLAATTFVLWDADHYAARDHLEHIRSAWFGNWPQAFRFAGEKRLLTCKWKTVGGIKVCILRDKNGTPHSRSQEKPKGFKI